MTVEHLIKVLSNMDKDKIVVMTDPGGIGWGNIEKVIEEGSVVKIMEDDGGPFHN
jgi:hypothetical protein